MPKTFLIDPGQNPLEMPEIYERKQRSKRLLYLMAGLVIAAMVWLVFFRPKPPAAQPTETLEYTPTATHSATPTDNPQLDNTTAIAEVRERNSPTPNMPPTWTPQPRQVINVPVTVVVTHLVERQVSVPVNVPVQVTVPVPYPVTVVVTATPTDTQTPTPTPTATSSPTPTSTATQALPVYAWRVLLPSIVGGYNQPPVPAYPPP